MTVNAQEKGGQWQLDGAASYVLHGQNANALIVVANDGQTLGAFVVEVPSTGIVIDALQTFDHTLRMAKVTLDGVVASRLSAKVPVWDAVDQALQLGLVAQELGGQGMFQSS